MDRFQRTKHQIALKKAEQTAYMRGINQTQLAEKVGISQGSLSYILRGRKDCSEHFIIRVAQSAGMSELEIDDLLKKSEIQAVHQLYGHLTGENRVYTTDELLDKIAEIEGFSFQTKQAIKDYIALISAKIRTFFEIIFQFFQNPKSKIEIQNRNQNPIPKTNSISII